MSDEKKRPPGPWWRDRATVVALIFLGGYFVPARVLLNFFPYSSFAMYSTGTQMRDGEVRGSHLLARGEDGSALDVSEYRAWRCPEWQEAARRTISELRCDPHFNVEEHIREYLEDNKGPDPRARPVSLIRRAWIFKRGEAVRTVDVLVAECKAVRK